MSLGDPPTFASPALGLAHLCATFSINAGDPSLRIVKECLVHEDISAVPSWDKCNAHSLRLCEVEMLHTSVERLCDI